MNITLTETQISNLLVFLDRVPITGFKEISAFNEIINVLTNNSTSNQQNILK